MRFLFWATLLSVALLVRIGVVFNTPNSLSGDEISFDVYGWSMAQGKGMAKADGTPTSIRPPLYPLFLGTVYSILGHHPIVVKLVQCFLSVATILVVYQIARSLASLVFARWVAILCSFYFPNIMAPTRLYAESLYLFCLSLSFWALSLYCKRPRPRLAIVSGVGLGFATLTRAAGLALAFLLIPLLIWRARSSGKTKGLAIGLALFFGVGFSLPILPWTFRNWKVHHAFVLLTTEPGHTLYYAYFPKDGKIFGLAEETPLSQQALGIANEVERSRFLWQGVIHSILQKPSWFLVHQLPLKVAYFWSPFDWELFGSGIYDGSYIFLFPFFLWGLWGLSRFWKDYIPLWVLMFYPFLLALLFYGSGRLRYPTTPAFLIFAAFGLKQFFQRWKINPASVGLLSVFAGINLILTFNSLWIKELARMCLQGIGMW